MVGHPQPALALGEIQLGEKFGHILRQRRHRRRIRRQRATAEHVSVILHRGAAAAGVDDDRIEPLAQHFGHECPDIAFRRSMGQRLLAHVVGKRAAAAHALWHHDLHPQPGEQPDGGIVDVGIQHLLGAAGHQRHPLPAPLGHGEDLRSVIGRGPGQPLWRHHEHRPEPRVGDQPAKGPAKLRQPERKPEPPRIGYDPRQNAAQQPVNHRPLVGLLDIGTGLVDKVHVMHARGAGRHAGKAGQAAVDMLHRAGIGGPPAFEHVLDQVDPPARTVEFVAEHLVGRAGGGAHTAMHTGAQDLVGPRDTGLFELLRGEEGLHLTPPSGRGSESPVDRISA